MQLVRAVPVTAGEYVAKGFHSMLARPVGCLVCGAIGRLEALGYYGRGITVGRRVERILVRRFRCLECGRTVSILPSFAQPYRLVENKAIDDYFETETVAEESPWKTILASYRRRFARWLPELRKVLSEWPGRAPPFFETGHDAWLALRKAVGKLEAITEFLVAEFRITPFGRYRCHQRPHTP